MATEKITLSIIQNRTNLDYNFIQSGNPLSGYEENTGPPASSVLSVEDDGVNLTVTEFFEGRLCQPEYQLSKDIKVLAAIVQNLGQTGAGPMQFVTISSNDTEADYLEDKLLDGEGLELVKVEESSGGFETLTINVKVKNSIEIDNDALQLDGDAASPGNSKFYGTSTLGVKGWRSLPVKNSLEEDSAQIQLVNDENAPGNHTYYGTDGAGVKGFHDLPDIDGVKSISAATATDSIGDEETTTIELVNDEAAPGSDKYYGTNRAGTKGFHDLLAGRSYFFASI